MRINIVGLAVGWRDVAGQPGETWGVNDLVFKDELPLARSFDIHAHARKKKKGRTRAERRTHAAERGIRFVDCDNYPLGEIRDRFGTDYFCSSIDYMLALALLEGAKEIHLYGVDMSMTDEYAHQKPSAEYWIGYARGMGVTVVVHGKNSRVMRIKGGITYGFMLPQKYY